MDPDNLNSDLLKQHVNNTTPEPKLKITRFTDINKTDEQKLESLTSSSKKTAKKSESGQSSNHLDP